jgi:hypothetical protein
MADGAAVGAWDGPVGSAVEGKGSSTVVTPSGRAYSISAFLLPKMLRGST